MEHNNESSSGISSSCDDDKMDQSLEESPSYKKNETYMSKGGGKPTWQGPDYQLKLSMLFAWKAMKAKSCEVDFHLATEMRDSDWDAFDDLVFRYSKDGIKYYRYLQAKHCYLGDKKVKIVNLKSKSKSEDFRLQKYFKSYLIIEQKLEPDEHLKDIIICTNRGFDFENFENDEDKKRWKNFLEEKTDDPILDVGGKIYQLEKSKIKEAKEELKDTFVKGLQEKKEKVPFLEYLSSIYKNRLPTGEEQMTSSGDSSEPTGNKDEILLNECLDKMEDFLDKLVFAVEQPSGAELDKIIKNEIGAEFNLINRSTYDAFFKYMSDWMKHYKKINEKNNLAHFLTREDLEKFFDSAKKEIASLSMVSLNLLYKGKIYEYGIKFKDDIEELKKINNFLSTRDEQILMIYQSKTLLTGIKVFQVLSSMKTKHYKPDEYICSDLKSLSILKDSSADPIKMFESDSRNLVIIEHNNKGKEIILNFFFNVLVRNPEKKIIIITSEEQKENIEEVTNDWVEELAYDKKIRWTKLEDKSNKLTDLTAESQTSLVNKEGTVIFQGNEVSLATLINENTKHLISGEVLFKVINDEKTEIGQKLGDQKYNEIKEFYIDRKFYRYADSNSTHFNSIEDKVVIIVAAPGMGKSTVLSHIALQKKESQPSLMILKVNLINYSKEFKKLKEHNGEEELFKFLYRIYLNNSKPESQLKDYQNSIKINIEDNELSCTKGEECKLDDVSWFKIQLFNEYYNQGKIFFMLDGYDEISPKYKGIVMELLKVLKNSKSTIWISTRPYNISGELENEFCVSSYTLQPFSENDKKTYLKQFWGFDDERSDRFVELLLRLPKDFTSNPLQLHMLAVVLKDKVKGCCNSDKNYDEFIPSDFSYVYHRFVGIKFHEIHIKEKVPGLDNDRLTDKKLIADAYCIYLENHKKLAAYTLLSDSEVRLFLSEKELKHDIPKKIEEIKSAKEKTGIITHVADNKPVFVHLTYAEYFLSLLIYDKLDSGADYSVCKFLLDEILMDEKYEVIRRFLNGLLKDYTINGKTSEHIMKALETRFKYYSSLTNSLKTLLEFIKTTKFICKNLTQCGSALHKCLYNGGMLVSSCWSLSASDVTNTIEELKVSVESFQKNHPNWLENIPTFIKSELAWSIKSFIIRGRSKMGDCIEILDSLKRNKPNWLEYILDDDDEKRCKTTEILKEIYRKVNDRDTLLHIATREGLDIIIEFLLDKHPVHFIASYDHLRKDFINCTDHDGYTALDHAVGRENDNIVRLLLRNGALITTNAIRFSKEKVYQVLLEFFTGDNVKVPSNHLSKCIPGLDISISEVKKQIEKHGINHQDWGDDTLLHKALQGYNYELAIYLINEGADVNIKNSSADTPLSLAVTMFCELIRCIPFLYDCPACNPPSSEDLVVKNLIEKPSLLMSIIRYISGQHFASKTIEQFARICELLLDKGTDENELRGFTKESLDRIAARIKLLPSNGTLLCTKCKREFRTTK